MSGEYASISVLENNAVNAFCVVASAALVFYNWIISFDQEIEHVWKRKLNGPTILFFLNQYSQILIGVSSVFALFGPQSVAICEAVNIVEIVLTVLYFMIIAVFSSLRVWAISGKRFLPAIFILVLSFVPPATNLYTDTLQHIHGISSLPLPYGGCSWNESTSAHSSTIIAVCTRLSAIICDLVVLMITWKHTYHVCQMARKAGIESRLSGLLLKDGTLYFSIMFVMNIVQMSFNLSLIKSPVFYNFICPINIAMTSVLISRFILNLRAVDSAATHELTTLSETSYIEFAVGNLGGDLEVSSVSGDLSFEKAGELEWDRV